MKHYPSDAVIRWTVHPAAKGRLAYLAEVVDDSGVCPQENEVITRPFLVDPVSRAEVPVRVVQVLELLQERPPVLAVLVTRDP
jgi:hypothetical protein